MKFLLLPLCLILAITPAQAKEAVGFLSEVYGEVSIQPVGEADAKPANLNDQIFIGDKILTDMDEQAIVEFTDGTIINVTGKDGELTIDEFVYDPEDPSENKSRFSILRAAFEYTSGLVSKGHNNSSIRLDFGSIGIRGTHIFRAMQDMECWIYVEDGIIDVSNNAGQVTLNHGEGTRMSSQYIEPHAAGVWKQNKIDWVKAEVARKSAQ